VIVVIQHDNYYRTLSVGQTKLSTLKLSATHIISFVHVCDRFARTNVLTAV